MADAKSQIDDGLCLLDWLADERRYVAVLHAYLDESGTDDKAHILSVAGFYGSGNQWRIFRKLWKPYAKGFHAKNSTSRFPQLCHAIEKSKINGIVITINKNSYKENATPHVKTIMGNPYSTAALLCATVICDAVHPRRVSFSIEEGQSNTDFVRRVLEGLQAEKHLAIAAIATVQKTDFIELHTADFVSHVTSTMEAGWRNRLILAGRLTHPHLPGSGISTAAPEITDLIRKARFQRKKEALSRPKQPSITKG